MTLHGGDSIAELAKGHIFIRRTLVFQKQMDVSVIAGGSFHAPENVTGVLNRTGFVGEFLVRELRLP